MKNLKSTRLNRGIRQDELAKLLSVTKGTYSKYENGELQIPTIALRKLSEYLDLSSGYLLDLYSYPIPLSNIELLKDLSIADTKFLIGDDHNLYQPTEPLDAKKAKILELFNTLTVSEMRKMVRIIRALSNED